MKRFTSLIAKLICFSIFTRLTTSRSSSVIVNSSPRHLHEKIINSSSISNAIIHSITSDDKLVNLISDKIREGSNNESSHISLLERSLGNFDTINEIFKGVQVKIPDMFIDLSVDVTASNIICQNFSVQDIIVSYKLVSNTKFDFSIDVKGLALDCSLDIDYKWGFISGDATAQLYTSDNNVGATITFTSPDFNKYPPNEKTTLSRCITEFELNDIDFQGDLLLSIVEIFQGPLLNSMENTMSDVACDTLDSFGNEQIGGLLKSLGSIVEMLSQPLPPHVEDPLHVQNSLDLPEDVQLLNLSQGWLQPLFDQLSKYLTSVFEDLDNPNSSETTLNINKLIQAFLLDENRALVIPFQSRIIDTHDLLTETSMNVTSIKIYGLDTFTTFDPIKVLGNYTIGSQFNMDYLRVEVYATISIKPSTTDESVIETGSIPELIEDMVMKAGLNDIAFSSAFFLGIDTNAIGDITLGSILHTEKILPCLISSLYNFNVTGLSIDAKSIELPSLQGFIEDGVDKVISSTAEAVISLYENGILQGIHNIFQSDLRGLANNAITEFLQFMNHDCFVDVIQTALNGKDIFGYNAENMITAYNTEDAPIALPLLNLADLMLAPMDAPSAGGTGTEPYGDLIYKLMTWFREKILGFGGGGLLNTFNDSIVSKLTQIQSGVPGTLLLSGSFFTYEGKIPYGSFVADVELDLSDLKIENLDSMGSPLDIFSVQESYSLDNQLIMGTAPKSIRGSIVISLSYGLKGFFMDNRKLLLGLELSDLSLTLDIILKAIENSFTTFPLRNVGTMDCWLTLFPKPQLDNLFLRPEYDKSEIMLGIQEFLLSSPNVILFTEELETDEGAATSMDITKLFNLVAEYLTDKIAGTFGQMMLDRLVSNAEGCPSMTTYKATSSENVSSSKSTVESKEGIGIYTIVAVSLIVGTIIIYTFILIGVNRKVKRTHNEWMKSLTPTVAKIAIEEQDSFRNRLKDLDDSTTSLIRSPDIPVFARLFIPVVILGNIGLFLSGHLSLGATVLLTVNVGGFDFSVDDLLDFALGDSIVDMWESGARELSVFILIFSGIWPYVKQVMTFAMWVMPPSYISVTRRGSILCWLDILGKWSFVDIIILVLSLIAFRLSEIGPEVDIFILQGTLYEFNLHLILKWGLYANMIAQLVSQINSHVIIHYHRKVVTKYEQEHPISDATEDTTESLKPLRKHSFKSNASDGKKTFTLSNWVNMMVVFVALAIIGGIIAGALLPTLSLDYLGLVGVLMESNQDFENATRYFSIISIVKALIEQIKYQNLIHQSIGLGTLIFVFIFTVVVTPILNALLLLQRWFIPMSKKSRMRNFVTIEICQSWQYVEIYIISVLIAVWQLGLVSGFLVNDKCEDFSNLFSMLAAYGFLSTQDAQCFQIEAKGEAAILYLIGSAILLFFLNTFVSMAARHQEKDDEEVKQIVHQELESIEEDAKDVDLKEYSKLIKSPSPSFIDYFSIFLHQ